MTAEEYIKRIPFAVAALSATCTKTGSHEREIAERMVQAVRADVEAALKLMEAKR